MKSFIYKTTGKVVLLFFTMTFSLSGFCQSNQPAAQMNQEVRTVLHLLGYVSGDYQGAVRNGQIISKAEYAEMTEFSKTALEKAKHIFGKGNDNGIIKDMERLQLTIRQKEKPELITTLSEKINQQIIKVTGFKSAPSGWPDLDRGKMVYRLNCASCHGASGGGDGKLAVNLTPPPADLSSDALMKAISPFEAYNTVHLGVQGTAMPAFSKLSEDEAWDVAFYIETLKYNNDQIQDKSLSRIFDTISRDITLTYLSTHSDEQILAKLAGNPVMAEKQLLSLRLHSENRVANSLDFARQAVNASLALYQKGDFSGAKQKALAAYLEGIEPIEARLRASDPGLTNSLEQQMLNMRSVINNKKPVAEVEKEVNTSLAMIGKADRMLQNGKLTFWLAFFLSGSILLREGLEAFLIIAVMLALIRKTGRRKALVWIHSGWFIAIILGFAGWFLSDWVLRISGKNREMMEGLVSLFAVCVLISAGLWLHNKSHVKHWKKFVEEKIGKLVRTENMVGLGLFSFMVVFREAFESILFLQAVRLETPSGQRSSIGLGVLAALAAIAVLVVIFLKFSGKIPIRQLFRYSSWMIVVLAVILVGDGIHAMQEAGFLSVTPLMWMIRLGWLGIYPTIETIIPQLILIALITGIWYVGKLRLRHAM